MTKLSINIFKGNYPGKLLKKRKISKEDAVSMIRGMIKNDNRSDWKPDVYLKGFMGGGCQYIRSDIVMELIEKLAR